MTAGQRYEWRRLVVFSGANLAAVGIICIVTILPFAELLQGQRQRIDQTAAGLNRMMSLLDRREQIETRKELAADWLAKPFLHGDSLNLMNTELLARLRRLADQHQVVFNSLASQPPRIAGGFYFVGARVEFAAPSSQASQVLSSMENGRPFLYLHSVRLSALPPSDAGGEMVSVTLDVYGATRWRKS